MIVASALIRIGLSTESAFRPIEESRGCPVPDTREQRQWIERHSSGLESESIEPRLTAGDKSWR